MHTYTLPCYTKKGNMNTNIQTGFCEYDCKYVSYIDVLVSAWQSDWTNSNGNPNPPW